MSVASSFDPDCQLCPRLVAYREQLREQFPDYHNAPVPAFGDPAPRVLVVGLAPGLHGANASGRPFTGDFAGILLYRSLFEAGFADRPESRDAADGLKLDGLRITNAVKCLPPANKPTTGEANACLGYLRRELDALPPSVVVLALGTVAHRSVVLAAGGRPVDFAFGHGACHRLPDGRRLVDSYHCSRYNTQTGRLTPAMFAAALDQARSLAGTAA